VVCLFTYIIQVYIECFQVSLYCKRRTNDVIAIDDGSLWVMLQLNTVIIDKNNFIAGKFRYGIVFMVLDINYLYIVTK